jgi:Raf kinase inhibitor-like YbhB/YbcL family protein
MTSPAHSSLVKLTMSRVRRIVRAAVLAVGAASAQADSAGFSLSSTDFQPGRPIPAAQLFDQYGCTGQNRSPALQWHAPPAGTKSYAVTMFDLDESGAPSGWWHWVVYDIPASASGLAQNAGRLNSSDLPPGAIQGRTDMSQDAYHGPCPDKGQPPHRYLITVYALSVNRLPVPPEASGAMVSYTVRSYTLGRATLTARFGR